MTAIVTCAATCKCLLGGDGRLCLNRLGSPILFPLDTSSRVYTGTTLCLLVVSGTQSLTGLKLILLCEKDACVPSLPNCNSSIELTRAKDIAGGAARLTSVQMKPPL